ncbi:MAG: hypothetical protein LUC24_00625 [Bacteroidales bacterium]|nr:hypothetical protein [Bacteroidales bacterium]
MEDNRIRYKPGMYRYVYSWFWWYVQKCVGYREDGEPEFERTEERYRDRDYARKRVYRLNGWKLKEAR